MKELINKIENSNFLNNEQKTMMIDSISVGGSVSVDIRKVQTELKLAILEILFVNNEPLTITEIADNFALKNGYCYTVQKFAALARQLVAMGLVNRNTIITGNSIIVKGKRYPEEIAKFSFIKAWQIKNNVI